MNPEARNYDRWISRWEAEGGAIPQVAGARKRSANEQHKAITLRTILVPIDFSPESLKTLRYAELLAKRFGANLHLVHVITPPLASRARPATNRSLLLKELTANAGKRLAELAVEHSLPTQPKPYTVRTGRVAEEINEVALAKKAGLIAIATRGFTGLKHAFLGSTTERVLRTAPCPVLVVRERDRAKSKQRARRGRTPPQFRKLLVPVDFSRNSRFAVEYALRFAREFGSRLVLFHSIPVTPFMLGEEQTMFQPNLIPLEQEHAREQMEKLRKEISGKTVEVETETTFGSPVGEIDNYVAKKSVDLIIISTHGRSGLERFFIGSTAERIVRYAPSSVLVVPNRTLGGKEK